MRVLMLNYEYPPLGGGAGNATRGMLAAFALHGDIAVDLVTASEAGGHVQAVADRIHVHKLDIGKNHRLHYQSNRDLLAYSWRAWNYARSLASSTRYDCCHAFFGIPCGYLAMNTGMPYIVSLRGSDVPSYNPRFAIADAIVFRRLSRKIWRRAAAVVANSDGLRELALQSSPEQPIDVIANGVDTARFTPAPTLADPNQMISVARLIPRKGIDAILHALPMLPQAMLTVVGTGPAERELRALAESLGVATRVVWAGHLNHDALPERYRAAGVFVLPSRNEGMSNAALEAMASGLPLLLTATGGTRELLHDGVNGFVIRTGAPDDIIARVNWYAVHRAEHARQGSASRAKAAQLSWSSSANAYLALYRRAAGVP